MEREREYLRNKVYVPKISFFIVVFLFLQPPRRLGEEVKFAGLSCKEFSGGFYGRFFLPAYDFGVFRNIDRSYAPGSKPLVRFHLFN